MLSLLMLLLAIMTAVSAQTTQSCGVCGIPGIPGTDGTRGPRGRRGRVGRDGAKGDRGLQGNTGPQGPPGDKGPAGAKGEKGAIGETGAQGPPGQKGEPGPMPIKNWKECVWKNVNDDKDNGLIKDCVFTKKFSDTALHVYWTGSLRIAVCNSCCKRWYFTFNGAECSGPLPIDGIVFMRTGSNSDIHRVRHIEGHCNNIHKGNVRVGFWIGNCAGYGYADGYTGWNSVSRIFVEEVPKAQA